MEGSVIRESCTIPYTNPGKIRGLTVAFFAGINLAFFYDIITLVPTGCNYSTYRRNVSIFTLKREGFYLERARRLLKVLPIVIPTSTRCRLALSVRTMID